MVVIPHLFILNCSKFSLLFIYNADLIILMYIYTSVRIKQLLPLVKVENIYSIAPSYVGKLKIQLKLKTAYSRQRTAFLLTNKVLATGYNNRPIINK